MYARTHVRTHTHIHTLTYGISSRARERYTYTAREPVYVLSCVLRFIVAPLTGGLRPSKGCACGYVHNTVHRRMHVGPWMRRRASALAAGAWNPVCTCAHLCIYVCVSRMCVRHLRRGVNDDGGTTTRVAGRNCEVAARWSARSSWHFRATVLKSVTSSARTNEDQSRERTQNKHTLEHLSVYVNS